MTMVIASGPQTEGFATASPTIFCNGDAELKERQLRCRRAGPPRAPIRACVGSDCGLIADVHRDLTSLGKVDGVIGVDTPRLRSPVLVTYYNRYLTNNDCGCSSSASAGATRARRSSGWWRWATARRGGPPCSRLSLMGDYSSNAVLGRALVDRDRGVRTIAENGIRELVVPRRQSPAAARAPRRARPQRRAAIRRSGPARH